MSEHSFEEHLANEDDFELRSRAKKRRVAVGIASAVANIASSIVSFAGRSFNYGGGRKSGAKTIKRDRVDIDKQIHQLDDRHFRRKYRMDKDSEVPTDFSHIFLGLLRCQVEVTFVTNDGMIEVRVKGALRNC